MSSRRLLDTCRKLSRLDQLLAIKVPGPKPSIVSVCAFPGWFLSTGAQCGGEEEGRKTERHHQCIPNVHSDMLVKF